MTNMARSGSASDSLRAGIRFRSLLKQLDVDPGAAPDCAVHHGGPVEPGRGFVLHSNDWGGQDTIQVAGPDGPLYAMTGTLDVLKAIAEGRGPERWLIALGYAGWEAGQLDAGNDPPRLVRGARRGEPVVVRHPDRRAVGRGVPRRGDRSATAGRRDRRG